MEKFDIYWIDIFYDDDPSKFKTRPAVVIDPEKETLLTLKLSTNLLTPVPNYELEDYKEEGLKKPSTVILKYFIKPSPSAIKGFIGHLTKKDEEGLTELIKKFPPKNESLKEENIMDEKQKKAMERLEKMYQNPKYKDAIDALLNIFQALEKGEDPGKEEEERLNSFDIPEPDSTKPDIVIPDPFSLESDPSFEHDDDYGILYNK